MPTAQKLPPLAEQGRLIRDLRKLIDVRGWETLVSAPLLEPRREHFPDPWRPDALGVERLARRLLIYAGLPELDVDVELFSEERIRRRPTGGTTHEGAAAWFAGFVDGRCQFGAHVGQLDTPDRLAGVMAHEVAHAYRHRHHLNTPDRKLEEPLTDLTTVYLGFGMLTTNAAYRYRASGGLRHTEWSHDKTGYLSPQAMSLLLAVQVVARGLPARGLPASERRRLAGLLETNQAAYFTAACESLQREAVIEKLGLPPPAAWPAVATPAPVAFDTSGDPPLAVAPKKHAGLPIFRIRKSRAAAWFLLAFGPAVAGAVVLCLNGAPAWSPFALATVVLGAGAMVGRRRAIDVCSEPDCSAIVAADATTCPGCGGVVSGRIAHENDRMTAREALLPPEDEDLEHDDDDFDDDAAEASSS